MTSHIGQEIIFTTKKVPMNFIALLEKLLLKTIMIPALDSSHKFRRPQFLREPNQIVGVILNNTRGMNKQFFFELTSNNHIL